MDRREIEDRLEACRPDSHDLSREELREAADALFHDQKLAARFERQQRLDAQLADSMREVAAPAGLADRILAQLATADATNCSANDASKIDNGEIEDDPAAPLPLAAEFDADDSPVDRVAEDPVTPASRFAKQRALKFAGAAAAMAACLLLAAYMVGWFDVSESIVSEDTFHRQAISWTELVESNPWKIDGERAKAYPTDVMLGGPRGFQVLDPNLRDTDEMLAFDFSFRGQRAYLFVADTTYGTANMISNGPAVKADPITGGWNLAAWRNGPLLYVLVFEGDSRDYHRFVGPGGGIASIDVPVNLLVSR